MTDNAELSGIDPAHKAAVDAAVTRAFRLGVHVHIPQTADAYAMCRLEPDGRLVITSELLTVDTVTIDPAAN